MFGRKKKVLSASSALRVSLENDELPLHSNATVDADHFDVPAARFTVIALARSAVATWSGREAHPASITSSMLLEKLGGSVAILKGLVQATLAKHKTDLGFSAATFSGAWVAAGQSGNLKTVGHVYDCALKGCGLPVSLVP